VRCGKDLSETGCALRARSLRCLFVDGKEITDLHLKIAGGKNLSLSSHSYKFEKGKFYLATTQSQSASYALEIEEPFDFKKLRWSVTHFELGKYEAQDLLTIEYGDPGLTA